MFRARSAWLALLAILAGAGFAAQASIDRRATGAATAPSDAGSMDAPLPSVRAGAAGDQGAPSPGSTGTIALPALPAAAASGGDAGIVPARPFAMTGNATDRMRALQCLTSAIYYEAASEPDAGQAAVAQVILNRVRHPAFPATVCGVVYQGSDRRGCQFSYACDGSLARAPMRSAWDRAHRAAARALAGYVFAPVGLATHYHTYAVTPAWNRSLVMTDVEGAHFFHRWKGWWGTSAAFSQPYRGGEPLPAPLSPPAGASPGLTLAANDLLPGAVTAAPLPAAPLPAVQDEPVESGSIRPEYRVADADAQMLDRWKDSGKPLR